MLAQALSLRVRHIHAEQHQCLLELGARDHAIAVDVKRVKAVTRRGGKLSDATPQLRFQRCERVFNLLDTTYLASYRRRSQLLLRCWFGVRLCFIECIFLVAVMAILHFACFICVIKTCAVEPVFTVLGTGVRAVFAHSGRRQLPALGLLRVP